MNDTLTYMKPFSPSAARSSVIVSYNLILLGALNVSTDAKLLNSFARQPLASRRDRGGGDESWRSLRAFQYW